jgi:hypothetical protein
LFSGGCAHCGSENQADICDCQSNFTGVAFPRGPKSPKLQKSAEIQDRQSGERKPNLLGRYGFFCNNGRMQDVKDTRRAHVRIAFDGRVFKSFRGHQARERFENEVRVLRYLEERGCPFVPVVLETNPDELLLVTSNCGKIVENIGMEKMEALHKELHQYGVRHGDWDMRNITYSQQLGRFCIIDFEFASILDDPTHVSPVPMPPAVKAEDQ